jgi:hypothetical protein
VPDLRGDACPAGVQPPSITNTPPIPLPTLPSAKPATSSGEELG